MGYRIFPTVPEGNLVILNAPPSSSWRTKLDQSALHRALKLILGFLSSRLYAGCRPPGGPRLSHSAA